MVLTQDIPPGPRRPLLGCLHSPVNVLVYIGCGRRNSKAQSEKTETKLPSPAWLSSHLSLESSAFTLFKSQKTLRIQ